MYFALNNLSPQYPGKVLKLSPDFPLQFTYIFIGTKTK